MVSRTVKSVSSAASFDVGNGRARVEWSTGAQGEPLSRHPVPRLRGLGPDVARPWTWASMEETTKRAQSWSPRERRPDLNR